MNNKKLEKWLAKNDPAKKISRFDTYRDDINILISKNFTQVQICEYLKEAYNIEVTRSNLSKYLKNHKEYLQPKQDKQDDKTSQKDKNEEYLQVLNNFGNVN